MGDRRRKSPMGDAEDGDSLLNSLGQPGLTHITHERFCGNRRSMT